MNTPTALHQAMRTGLKFLWLSLSLLLGLAMPLAAQTLTWSNATSMNTARVTAAAVVLNDGKVLVTGGRDASNTALNTAEIYDPVAGTWTNTGNMTTARWLHKMEKLPDGRVLVMGGRVGGASTEIYNPATGTFTAGPNMAFGRDDAATVVLADGRVLNHGGWNGATQGEIYNPDTNTWTSIATSVPRITHELLLLPTGKVLMIGSYTGGVVDTTTYLYDPAANTWTASGPLDMTRYNTRSVLLPSGKVLTTTAPIDGGNTSTCELYDIATGTWSYTASSSVFHGRHHVGTMADGRVLAIAGGTSAMSIYDPAAGTWATGSPLTTSRQDGMVVRLLDGKFLAAGGYNGSATINTVEIFDGPPPPPAPTVASISPNTGSTAGGTSVTLTGTDFTGATGVTIGGVSATSVVVTNATTITCTTPAGTAGTASVLVTTPGGTNAANTLYTYVAPPPTLASLSPASGVTAGGTSVTLTGTNFTGATDVTIGGAAATSVVVVNDTTLTATTPAGTAGTASVLVTTPGGTNAANTLFTYYDVVASYTTGTEVPVTAAGYTATGKTVALSLNFAPTPGTELQVVNNTAPVAFITGRFSNLAQGQVVYLDYAGNSYKFVAHYYGGTGNDLVLVWGKTRLYSWGNNNNGALGNGSTGGTALAPQAVLSNSSVDGKTILATAAGSSHSVALLSDGTLVSWGFNSSNQLGDGTSTSRYYPVPVTVTGTALAGKTVVAVAAGSNHTLVLCSDGTLAAWGGNSNGQLGDNSTTNRSTAVAVLFTGALSGKTVVQIGAGSSYSQVLCSDGTVVSWGNNGSGAFGNGSNTHSQVPVAMTQTGVLNGKSVTRIAPGNSFTMVVCSDGTVACSGYNYDGQMGNGTSGIGTDAYSPVLVTTSGVLSGKTVVEASSGSVFAGVVCSDGTVATWGYYGQVNGRLGDNTSTKSRVPVLVNSANGVSALFGKTPTRLALNSAWRAIAMCSDGSFACWGDSPGDNTSNTRLAPVALYLGNLAANEKILSTVSGPSASHYLAIVGAPLAPAISVLGNSVAIANGSSATSSANFTSLGGLAAGSAGTVTRTFTISSTGENPLNLSGTPKVSLSGADAADFS
jgi:alpha-tubulin suppressor-like RCC1 family protein